MKFSTEVHKVRSSFSSDSTEVLVSRRVFTPSSSHGGGGGGGRGHHVVGEPSYGERGGLWEEEYEGGGLRGVFCLGEG